MLYASYSIGSALGFNLIFIILGLIGVALASVSAVAWVPYGLGVVLNTLSLIGRYRSYAAFGIKMGVSLDVVVFVVLAIVFGLLILKRRSDHDYYSSSPSSTSSTDRMYPGAMDHSSKPESTHQSDHIVCPFCKKAYPLGTVYCEDCNARIGSPKSPNS